jgi:hypothetical protein
MRELKFRVWNPDEVQMMYFTMDNIWFADRYLVQSKFNVQQYTGLKDWMGKEIYEGDIVSLTFKDLDIVKEFYKQSKDTLLPLILEHIKDNVYTGQVKYDEPSEGSFGLLGQFTYYIGLIRFADLKCLVGIKDIEVIGNIFENSELLESNRMEELSRLHKNPEELTAEEIQEYEGT